jgi:hypothetical protein
MVERKTASTTLNYQKQFIHIRTAIIRSKAGL